MVDKSTGDLHLQLINSENLFRIVEYLLMDLMWNTSKRKNLEIILRPLCRIIG